MKGWGCLLLLFTSVAFADDSIWGDFQVFGTSCNEGNVQILKGDSTLSFIFDDFGLHMPANGVGDGAEITKTCHLRVIFTPPPGYFMGGFEQVFSGGIIKSAPTVALLKMAYRVGPIIKESQIHWKNGEEITPANPRSVFTKVFSDPLRPVVCREKAIYAVRMELTGIRRNKQHFIEGGLDTLDANATPALRLVPQWKPCVPKPRR